jgi:hypothetical protein
MLRMNSPKPKGTSGYCGAPTRLMVPDDAAAGAGSVYLSDPLKLEQMLTG